jgi:hypothetical protein
METRQLTRGGPDALPCILFVTALFKKQRNPAAGLFEETTLGGES